MCLHDNIIFIIWTSLRDRMFFTPERSCDVCHKRGLEHCVLTSQWITEGLYHLTAKSSAQKPTASAPDSIPLLRSGPGRTFPRSKKMMMIQEPLPQPLSLRVIERVPEAAESHGHEPWTLPLATGEKNAISLCYRGENLALDSMGDLFKARAIWDPDCNSRSSWLGFFGCPPNLQAWNLKISVTAMLNVEKGENGHWVRGWKEYSADNAN